MVTILSATETTGAWKRTGFSGPHTMRVTGFQAEVKLQFRSPDGMTAVDVDTTRDDTFTFDSDGMGTGYLPAGVYRAITTTAGATVELAQIDEKYSAGEDTNDPVTGINDA